MNENLYDLRYDKGTHLRPRRIQLSVYAEKREYLKKLLQEGRSLTEIATLAEIPLGSISSVLAKLGLYDLRSDGRKTDGPGKRCGKNHWSYGVIRFNGELVPEDEVKTILGEFQEQDYTIARMAEECNVSPKTITNWLRRFGLQQGMRSGSRTPQWKGGHSKYRGPGWDKIRKHILERDGYKCRECGETYEEALANRHGLNVHHIVPFEQTQDNSDDNLITLCQPCHMVAEWKLGSHNGGS